MPNLRFVLLRPTRETRVTPIQGERALAPLEKPQTQSSRGKPRGISESIGCQIQPKALQAKPYYVSQINQTKIYAPKNNFYFFICQRIKYCYIFNFMFICIQIQQD